MTVYFQHVGEKGGQRDFPKTIGTARSGLKQFSFDEIAHYLRNLADSEQDALRDDLQKFAPNGFQIWGIPSGASSILKNLKTGDYLLLLEAAGLGGSFAYGGRVVAFPSSECFELSEHLWGEAKFPLIVFLNGELTNYPWQSFCQLLGYKTNWNPAGQTYRVTEEKMEHAGHFDDERLVEEVVGRLFPMDENMNQENDSFDDPSEEFFSTFEGREIVRQHIFRERSLKLVFEFKKGLKSFCCEICGFDFEDVYGKIGQRFIEAHHIKPLSEMDGEGKVSVNDLIAVCSNCHRMLHREFPALGPEELKRRLFDALERRSL
ncbi:MAG: HNH endonuclease [Anaerolineales bacterium]